MRQKWMGGQAGLLNRGKGVESAGDEGYCSAGIVHVAGAVYCAAADDDLYRLFAGSSD
ncbi:hypothetical protein D3C86_2238120 [compost metagenome]